MTPDLLLAVLSPPRYARTLASDDPDEISDWVARHDGKHSRVVHGTGPYGFRLARIATPVVQISWSRTRLPNTIRGPFRLPTFHVPLGGVQWYAHGRRRFEAATGRLVFMAPETEVTRRGDGDPVMAIELDRSAFESELQGRSGGERVEQPRVPQTLDLTDPQKRELIEAIAALAQAQLPGATAAARMQGDNRMLAALAGFLTASSGGKIMPVSVRRLRHLEDWIDAHLGEVISLGRLCEVAQVGERSLQLAFQARHGMSPMRFVAERRLSAAHRRFFSARADDNVTAIATSLGFTHLGRFSSAYRALFGESPSQALRRGGLRTRKLGVAAPARTGGGQ